MNEGVEIHIGSVLIALITGSTHVVQSRELLMAGVAHGFAMLDEFFSDKMLDVLNLLLVSVHGDKNDMS